MRSTYMASLNQHELAKSRNKLHLHGYKYAAQAAFPIPHQSLTLKMPGNFGLTASHQSHPVGNWQKHPVNALVCGNFPIQCPDRDSARIVGIRVCDIPMPKRVIKYDQASHTHES